MTDQASAYREEMRIARLEDKIAQQSTQKKRIGKRIRKEKKKEKETGWGDMIATGAKTLLHALPMILGFGDYEVKTNTLLKEAMPDLPMIDPPPVVNSLGATIVRHREYLMDVVGTTGIFQTYVFPIQPGLNNTFPWLSAIANNYQHYRLRGIFFEFRSLATNYSTNTYIGYVAIATQYNAGDVPFTNKVDLCNYEYSTTCRSDEHMQHFIECARGQNVLSDLYIRAGNVGTQDLRLYDLGNVTIATGGQPNAGTIGELWISYEIELFKPKSGATMGQDIDSAEYTGASVSSSAPFSGTAGGWAPRTGSNVILNPILNGGGGVIGFTVNNAFSGNFLMVLNWYGGTIGAAGALVMSYANCAVIGTTRMVTSGIGGATASYTATLQILANASNLATVLVAGGGAWAGVPSGGTLVAWFTQIPDAVIPQATIKSEGKPPRVQEIKCDDGAESEHETIELNLHDTRNWNITLLRRMGCECVSPSMYGHKAGCKFSCLDPMGQLTPSPTATLGGGRVEPISAVGLKRAHIDVAYEQAQQVWKTPT